VRAAAAASRTSRKGTYALVAVFVDQPVAGFRAVPVLALILVRSSLGLLCGSMTATQHLQVSLKSTWATNIG
jgi:hypothetical protein